MSLLPQTSPSIEVGILFASLIHFRLNGNYTSSGYFQSCEGEFQLEKRAGKYWLQHSDQIKEVSLPLVFQPQDAGNSDFELTDVVIGIHFHWERKENQRFKGNLKIIDEGEHLTAINILPLEDYLLSVISSEMSATSSLELLKAHAIISRSWLLAQKHKSRKVENHYQSCLQTEDQYIRWYDREDHAHFDVCADDHCQRYQGITKAYTPTVQKAIEATRGEVLLYGNKICDARFSKCCGGISERFENTWEPVKHPYLETIMDCPGRPQQPDLTQEEEARKWILSSPEMFCNTRDQAILSEILNDYDQETRHFFRWQQTYTTEELSNLVQRKLQLNLGTITDIIPLERGVSGRLIRIKICGTRKDMIIGKELLIRKAFSESHLYSSAFIVEKGQGTFTFYGAGWGHGVGLCQIGAAVMGVRGYSYQEILHHYFSGCSISKIY